MLQKLLMFSSNSEPPTDLEQHLSGVQTQMLVRSIVGTLNETWLLIERLFLSRPIARDYQTLLDAEGRNALTKLKRQFGESNLLNKVRNDFAFHYPKVDDVEAAFEAAFDDTSMDDHWKLYFSQYGFNSFYFLSDLIMVHGIRKSIGSADLIEAQQKLMNEVVEAVQNTFEFAKAFTAAAWIKNFGAEMQATAIVEIKGAPAVGKVCIPFFVEMDPSSVS